MTIEEVIRNRFIQFGYPLINDTNILPNEDDTTTLFICSGMQRIRNKFLSANNEKYGSLQACIRTNDIELVGDGTHLTHFNMAGNFAFGTNNYAESVELWHLIITDLGIKVDTIHVHPSQIGHKKLWNDFTYKVVDDISCVWSDGDIGGYCCEMYVGDLEIGNLVNTLGHSTDVGFGLERLYQVIENKLRVDETSLFNIDLEHPIVMDHARTLELLWRQQINPGNKGRNYVCRRLLRRFIRIVAPDRRFVFDDWIGKEKLILEERLKIGRRVYRRHKDRSSEFWWDTYGILPEEIELIRR